MNPKHFFYTALFLLVSAFGHKAIAQKSSNTSSQKLHSFANNYWKDITRLNPLFATQNGINDYNDQLEISISQSYIIQATDLNKKYIDSLKTIDKKNLNARDLLTADLLKYSATGPGRTDFGHAQYQ